MPTVATVIVYPQPQTTWLLSSVSPFLLWRAGSVPELLTGHLAGPHGLRIPPRAKSAPTPESFPASYLLSTSSAVVRPEIQVHIVRNVFDFPFLTHGVFIAGCSRVSCLSSSPVPLTRLPARLLWPGVVPPSPSAQIRFPRSSSPSLPITWNRNRIGFIPQEEPLSRSADRFAPRPPQSGPRPYREPSPTTLPWTTSCHS